MEYWSIEKKTEQSETILRHSAVRYSIFCGSRFNPDTYTICLMAPPLRQPAPLLKSTVLHKARANVHRDLLNPFLAPTKGGQVVCCAGPMLLNCASFTPCSGIWDVFDVSSHLNKTPPNPKYRSTLQQHNS